MDNNNSINQPKSTRHILAISGGKDSSALAIYMLNSGIDMEYVFCDTGEELDETYEYIEKLQNFISKKITILKSEKDFKYYLDLYNGVLPDPTTRWCTRMLKLRPYEDFIGNDDVISYVGIRADEPSRTGYISTKPNLKTVFPFIEKNIRYDDVIRILEESGLGIPKYYTWRSRSGCYFCFFQQKREWVGLFKNHPSLFKKAMSYEKIDKQGVNYTWNQDESLSDLIKPERIEQINSEYTKRKLRMKERFQANCKLSNIWNIHNEIEETEEACIICHL